jgi:hypothetical protein
VLACGLQTATWQTVGCTATDAGSGDPVVMEDVAPGLSSWEVVFASYDGSELSTWSGLGAPSSMPAARFSRLLALGDVNRDGRLDAVVASESLPRLQVFLGAGSGFALPYEVCAPNVPLGMVLGDLTSDGVLDIAVNIPSRSATGGTPTCVPDSQRGVFVMRGNGNGTFAMPERLSGLQGKAAAVGDFDGSGSPKLLLADGANGMATLLALDGGVTSFRVSNGPYFDLAAADFEGTGAMAVVAATAQGVARARSNCQSPLGRCLAAGDLCDGGTRCCSFGACSAGRCP